MSSPGYIPGPLVIPNVVQVKLVWILPNGKFASNVLHGHNDIPTAVDVIMADGILSVLAADPLWTAYALSLSTLTALQRISVRNLDAPLLPEFESTGDALPGTNATHPLPEGVALCCTLKSAAAGKSGRGRVYLSGYGNDQVDTLGHATAGCTGASSDFVSAVSNAMFSVGLRLTIANRAHDSYTSPATGLLVPAQLAGDNVVTQILVENNLFDSQRRRK